MGRQTGCGYRQAGRHAGIVGQEQIGKAKKQPNRRFGPTDEQTDRGNKYTGRQVERIDRQAGRERIHS
jgi:hypothetical protein